MLILRSQLVVDYNGARLLDLVRFAFPSPRVADWWFQPDRAWWKYDGLPWFVRWTQVKEGACRGRRTECFCPMCRKVSLPGLLFHYCIASLMWQTTLFEKWKLFIPFRLTHVNSLERLYSQRTLRASEKWSKKRTELFSTHHQKNKSRPPAKSRQRRLYIRSGANPWPIRSSIKRP